MADLSQFLNSGKTPIKSIQRGVYASGTGDVTISAVDLDKSFVSSTCANGSTGSPNDGGNSNNISISTAVRLKDSTTLSFLIGNLGSNGTVNNPTVYWEVIEYV